MKIKTQFGCECVIKLNEAIRRDFDPDGYLETRTLFNLETSESRETFPPIYFMARRKNASGKLTGKPRRNFFTANYCPSCGKPRTGKIRNEVAVLWDIAGMIRKFIKCDDEEEANQIMLKIDSSLALLKSK